MRSWLTVVIALSAFGGTAPAPSEGVPRPGLAASGDIRLLRTQAPQPPARATLAQLAWLAGEWRGTAGPLAFEEWWTNGAGGVMLAVARTVRAVTTIAPDSATFENPVHDFPKVIRYLRTDGGGLEAIVSDGARNSQRFVFTRAR